MEISVKNLSYFYKEKKILKNVTFTISSTSIVGLYGKYKTLLLEILDGTKDYQGKIFLEKEEMTEKNRHEYQRQVAFIPEEDLFYMNTVEEEMAFVIKCNHYITKDEKSRMLDAFRLVGLSLSMLKRKISELSKSEKTLLKIALAILTNPKVILFDDIFSYLSYADRKRILSLIRKLKERRGKLIVIASRDVDFLYEFTDELLLLEGGKLILQEKTNKVFKDVPFLEEHHLDIPYLIQFTSLAKAKKVRLSYHKDILDLIKDVYKHV